MPEAKANIGSNRPLTQTPTPFTFIDAMQEAVGINRLRHHDYHPPTAAGKSGSASVFTNTCIVVPGRFPAGNITHLSSPVPTHLPDVRFP